MTILVFYIFQIRTFQELIGRTDLLKVYEDGCSKAKLLNLNLVLRNALHMRPGVNIKGGSEFQDFQLENRKDNQLIELSKGVIDGAEDKIDIEMDIKNEERAFTSTLSYYISW